MRQSRSIFNDVPKYEIEKTSQEDQVNFNVTFNISTINFDYEKHAQKFAKGPVNQVNFKLVDDHKLVIDVTHHKQFSPENDHEFRSAIGVASRHNLQSTDVDAILTSYKKFLAEKGFNPPILKSQFKS